MRLPCGAYIDSFSFSCHRTFLKGRETKIPRLSPYRLTDSHSHAPGSNDAAGHAKAFPADRRGRTRNNKGGVVRALFYILHMEQQ